MPPNDRMQSGGGQREDAQWSVHVLTVAGIPIRLHITFLLLLAWLGYTAMRGPEGMFAALFIGGIFLCVLLHELGHAITSVRLGVGTKDIVLYPIGGVASLKRQPNPKQELIITVVGPLINIWLGVLFFLICELQAGIVPIERLAMFRGNWYEKMMIANFMLAGFNLIPAFPMDGGRILRALLAMKLGQYRATQIAATLGQGIAMIIGLYGLLFQPILLFISLFVFLGATAELQISRSRSLTEGVPAEAAMMTSFVSLKPGDSLQHATETLLAGAQPDFPVMQGEELVGWLTREDLLRGLGRDGRDGYVAGAMRREFPTVEPSTDLSEVVSILQQANLSSLPVLDARKVAGMISVENISEYFAVKIQTNKLSGTGGTQS